MTFSETLDRHLKAIALRNIAEFKATLSEDPQVMAPDGSIIAGFEPVLKAHAQWFSSTEFTFEPRIVWKTASGDIGLALVRVNYIEPQQTSRAFYLLLAFKREGDSWGMFYDQNTPIAAA